MLFSLLKGLEICFIYLLNCGKLYNKQVRLQQVFFYRRQTPGPFHLIFKIMFVSETKLICLATGETDELKISYFQSSVQGHTQYQTFVLQNNLWYKHFLTGIKLYIFLKTGIIFRYVLYFVRISDKNNKKKKRKKKKKKSFEN